MGSNPVPWISSLRPGTHHRICGAATSSPSHPQCARTRAHTQTHSFLALPKVLASSSKFFIGVCTVFFLPGLGQFSQGVRGARNLEGGVSGDDHQTVLFHTGDWQPSSGQFSHVLLHLNNSLCVSCEQAISQRLHEIYLLNLDLPPKEFSGEESFTSIVLLSMLTP